MNKAELIEEISDRLGIHKAVIASVLDSLAAVTTEHLSSGDAFVVREVALPGLGKLKTVHRAARTGRNPATGAEIEIPARFAVKFSAGKALDSALND